MFSILPDYLYFPEFRLCESQNAILTLNSRYRSSTMSLDTQNIEQKPAKAVICYWKWSKRLESAYKYETIQETK